MACSVVDNSPSATSSCSGNPLKHILLHADVPSSSTICLLPFIDDIVHQLMAEQDPQQQCSPSTSSRNSFPLVFDPRSAPNALIMGMFVIRPSLVPWASSLDAPFADFTTTLHDTTHQWAFNYRGLDGGWLIGNRNVLDAFRLALQYGVADAVIVSSMTVAMEGVDKEGEGKQGYMWQPYAVTDWPHLKIACPNALELISRQREAWQHQGFIPSTRKYPAQIIFTESGDRYPGSSDFLSARILTARHPSGEPIECYILTGRLGALSIRKRVDEEFPHLRDRLDAMILLLPDAPPVVAGGDEYGKLDISVVPELLYSRLGMRLVNHDGGQQVLRAFARAGALAQVNLTLCRNLSLKAIVDGHEGRTVPLDEYQSKVQLFFTPTPGATPTTSRTAAAGDEPSTGVPLHWKPIHAITDHAEDVVVVTFDTNKRADF